MTESQLGQFRFQTPLRRSPFQQLATTYAVQVYELRPDNRMFQSLVQGRWVIRQNSPFSDAGLARSLYYSLCHGRRGAVVPNDRQAFRSPVRSVDRDL